MIDRVSLERKKKGVGEKHRFDVHLFMHSLVDFSFKMMFLFILEKEGEKHN